MSTAALVVIGDEILTGKVRDENSFVFTAQMFERGVRVERIKTIPDQPAIIAKSVRAYASRYDYVCSSGGIGPTHDDRTYEGISLAFDLPLRVHEEALRYFQDNLLKAGRDGFVSPAQMKMLTFPSPCEVFFLKPLWLPLVRVRNVFILPGVPELFSRMLVNFRELFQGGKFFRELIYTDRAESVIADDLSRIQDEFVNVAIGSYPQSRAKAFNVMVTLEGEDEEAVRLATEKVLALIGGRRSES